MTIATPSIRHVVLVSGKDSAATAIVQIRRAPDLPYELIHNPTGWDLPETLTWLEKVGRHFGREIKGVGDDLTEITHDHGILPTAMVRFCTREAKIKPLRDYLGKAPAICYYGLRADEPERIGYKPSARDNIQPCYPLRELGMKLEDVWRCCQDADLLPPQFHWDWMERRVRFLLEGDQHLINDLPPWKQAELFAWRSRSNCDRCFNARQYEKVGLYEHHPDLFEDAMHMEETVGAEGYTWHVSYSLRSLIPRADEIKERRAMAIVKYLRERQQRMLFDADDTLDDALSVTSCGLLCGK